MPEELSMPLLRGSLTVALASLALAVIEGSLCLSFDGAVAAPLPLDVPSFLDFAIIHWSSTPRDRFIFVGTAALATTLSPRGAP